jgi:uncharacterized membrane protein SirB2
MEYVALKQLHIACVVLSYVGFVVRGIWMMRASPLLTARWVRIAPHVNDTLLLATAIALAVMSGQYPFQQGWLTAKVIALAVYIALGTVAFRPGRSRGHRVAAWIAAQVLFLYIVGVAVTRNPWIAP